MISVFICDPRGARTLGPQIKSLLLYQLSYGVSMVFKTGCKDTKFLFSVLNTSQKKLKKIMTVFLLLLWLVTND